MTAAHQLRSGSTQAAVASADWWHFATGTTDQHRRWRNGLFVLFLACLLAYGASFAWYLVSRFDLLNIIRDVNTDDSFYYFQIARNLAAGHFSTFDGGITQTNGYHPVWLLLITPFHWFMDAETALFGIKAFEIVLIAGAVLLIVVAARLAGQPWLLLFAMLPLFYGNTVLFMGMEAAAALFMLGLLFLTLGLYARRPSRWRWLLAAVAFALPWARLEYVAISLTATAALGAIVAWRQEPPDDATAGPMAWRCRVTSATTVPFLGALAGIAAYFAYNWLVFDGLVPVSGVVKAAWSQRFFGDGYSLFQNFQNALAVPAFRYPLLVAVEVCVYAPLVWWLTRRARSQGWLLLAFLVGAFSLGVGHIAKFVQTVLTVHPDLQKHFPWYYVPAYLLEALIVPVRCYVVMCLIRRYIPWRRAARLLSLSVVSMGVVVLLAQSRFTEPFRFVDRSSSSIAQYARWAQVMYSGTQVANCILPEGSIIGSWDAGVAGYFSRFPVVNLDGLVNSYDYFRVPNSRDFGVFRPLHRQLGITHFVNVAPRDLENTLFDGTFDLRSSGRRVKVSATEPRGRPPPSLWEGIAPHFDYHEGDVGLMVNHRVALALARNCAPKDVIAWSWNIPGGKPAFLAGKTGRGPGSSCVSEIVLPKAVPVKSVRAAALPAQEYLARLRAKQDPAIRSKYDVYLTEYNLIYTKESCAEDTEDVLARFVLHLYPTDAADLAERWKEFGFIPWDFDFREYGVQADGVCLLNVPLPGYLISRIRTGQYPVNGPDSTNRLWQEAILTDPGTAHPLQR